MIIVGIFGFIGLYTLFVWASEYWDTILASFLAILALFVSAIIAVAIGLSAFEFIVVLFLASFAFRARIF